MHALNLQLFLENKSEVVKLNDEFWINVDKALSLTALIKYV